MIGRTAALLIVIVAGVAGTSTPSATQDQTEIAVVVRDRSGRAVDGLKAGDFTLLIDGASVPFRLEARGPRTFLVLLDFSSSMFGGTAVQGSWHSDNATGVTGSRLGVVTREWARRGLQSLSERLRAGDTIRLASFGAGFTVTPPQTDSAGVMRVFPSVFQSDGPSPIWDVVDAGIRLLSQEDGRAVLILLTDGQPTASWRGFAEAADAAATSRVTIYTTAPPAAFEEQTRDRTALDPRSALETLASRTGGRLLTSGPGAAFTDAANKIVNDLDQQYTLVTPVRASATTVLTVSVPGRNVIVRF